jgi:hypothetical protein
MAIREISVAQSGQCVQYAQVDGCRRIHDGCPGPRGRLRGWCIREQVQHEGLALEKRVRWRGHRGGQSGRECGTEWGRQFGRSTYVPPYYHVGARRRAAEGRRRREMCQCVFFASTLVELWAKRFGRSVMRDIIVTVRL